MDSRFTRFRLAVGELRSRLLSYLLPFMPRAAWRLLPGTSETFGPPRRWQRWSDYARTHRVGWTAVFPAKSGRYQRPFWPPDGRLPFHDHSRYNWPEQGIAEIKGGRILSVHGWCIAPRDVLLGDFCFGGNRRTSFAYSLTLNQRPRFLKGTTLNLCSAHAAINFCHWLFDAVSRLALFEGAGYTLDEVDHILLPTFPGKTTAWVRAQLELPEEKLICPGQREQFTCETLLQPSFPGFMANYPPWVVDFYRRHFPAPLVPRTRKIYIARRGKRGLSNEAEIEAELRRRGFEEFNPAYQTELHLKLADVSHVVGVHGAALANLVFCPAGTRVLELLPSDMHTPYYYSLCDSGGMAYGVLTGRSLRQRRTRFDKPTHSAFHVDPEEFRAALDVLLDPSLEAPSSATAEAMVPGAGIEPATKGL